MLGLKRREQRSEAQTRHDSACGKHVAQYNTVKERAFAVKQLLLLCPLVGERCYIYGLLYWERTDYQHKQILQNEKTNDSKTVGCSCWEIQNKQMHISAEFLFVYCDHNSRCALLILPISIITNRAVLECYSVLKLWHEEELTTTLGLF